MDAAWEQRLHVCRQDGTLIVLKSQIIWEGA